MTQSELKWHRMDEEPDYVDRKAEAMNLVFTDGEELWHHKQCYLDTFRNLHYIHPDVKAWAKAEDLLPPAKCFKTEGRTAYTFSSNVKDIRHWLVDMRLKLISIAQIFENERSIVTIEYINDDGKDALRIQLPGGQNYDLVLDTLHVGEIQSWIELKGIEVIPPNRHYEKK